MARVERAASFGREDAGGGTVLYGHVPHVAPQAWFHTVYGGLAPEEVERVERDLGVALPEEYASLLRRSNGLNLFTHSLAVMGMQRVLSRDPSNRQPYDVVHSNRFERSRELPLEMVLVGGYTYDATNIYVDPETGHATRRGAYQDAVLLNEWPSLLDLLLDESERLSVMFDDVGRSHDPDAPTSPPPLYEES